MDDSLKNTYDENFESYMIRVGEDICFEPLNWDFPTQDRPGSMAKIQRMRWRLENAMPIHIPGDEQLFASQEEQSAAAEACKLEAKSKRQSKETHRKKGKSYPQYFLNTMKNQPTRGGA